jgi:hypothetical protein
MASTGSPRNNRRTTSFFRPVDHRFTSSVAPGSLAEAHGGTGGKHGASAATFDSLNIANSSSYKHDLTRTYALTDAVEYVCLEIFLMGSATP